MKNGWMEARLATRPNGFNLMRSDRKLMVGDQLRCGTYLLRNFGQVVRIMHEKRVDGSALGNQAKRVQLDEVRSEADGWRPTPLRHVSSPKFWAGCPDNA